MLLFLHNHHITELYVWVDQLVPKPVHNPAGGRPALLTDSELITILIWNTLVVQQQTLKGIYQWVRLYHTNEFPVMPSTYQGFVAACHRVTPMCLELLQRLLRSQAPVVMVDSTMVPVCKTKRANDHKVAKGIAKFGKNHQGWHYGFKLHTTMDLEGVVSAITLTPANAFDAHQLFSLLNNKTKVAVGDTTYGASVTRRKIWERFGTIVIAPPHPAQKKKLSAPWQIDLLNMRSKIESVFDILKQHLHLVSSFPRSVFGYLLHYIRILLAYQVMALSSVSLVF